MKMTTSQTPRLPATLVPSWAQMPAVTTRSSHALPGTDGAKLGHKTGIRFRKC
jgi:hypothetical protein